MRTAAPAIDVPVEVTAAPRIAFREFVKLRLADYLLIIKPKISVMVLLATAAGYVLAPDTPETALLPLLLGVGLVATASSAFNQWYERETDGRMQRTANRPLPAGRLTSFEVLAFGTVCSLAGTVVLVTGVNRLTAVLTLLTLVCYAACYTPLKRVSSLAIVVGAIPGAMPPVLGWAAASGRVDPGAWALFGILFLWQFPHFLAIAWIYREDYAGAGLKMLPGAGRFPHLVGMLAVAYGLVLLPVSVLPMVQGTAGWLSFWPSIFLGCMYLVASARFALHETYQTARGLLLTSLVYLPAILGVMAWEHLRNG